MRCVSPARLLGICLAVLACAEPPSGGPPEPPLPVDEALDRYEAGCRELLVGVRGDLPPREIAQRALSLAALSRGIAGDFAVAYPPCGPHLGSTLAVLHRLDSISLEEIERGYHAGDALPAAPDWCYHARDLVVHPATLVVLARDPQHPQARSRMEAELVEVLAHVGLVRRLLERAARP